LPQILRLVQRLSMLSKGAIIELVFGAVGRHQQMIPVADVLAMSKVCHLLSFVMA